MCSAEVRNAWSYTSILPYFFMSWCIVKHRTGIHAMVLGFKYRDNFTFTVTVSQVLYTVEFGDESEW
jgi:hypothetical protein